MKTFLAVIASSLLFFGCKNSSEEIDATENLTTTGDTIPAKIANTYGFDNFEDISQMEFTFNVKVNDSVTSSRSWNWYPRENRIELTEKGETSEYIREGELDENAKAIDRKFINDTYWFLFPFQLVWSDYEDEYSSSEEAPISQDQMQRLSVKYTGEGGYTPGDTYHLYFDDDYKVREWTYESSGGRSLSTTWEDHETFNGITVAKMHKSEDGNFQLYFSDIEVVR